MVGHIYRGANDQPSCLVFNPLESRRNPEKNPRNPEKILRKIPEIMKNPKKIHQKIADKSMVGHIYRGANRQLCCLLFNLLES